MLVWEDLEEDLEDPADRWDPRTIRRVVRAWLAANPAPDLEELEEVDACACE